MLTFFFNIIIFLLFFSLEYNHLGTKKRFFISKCKLKEFNDIYKGVILA